MTPITRSLIDVRVLCGHSQRRNVRSSHSRLLVKNLPHPLDQRTALRFPEANQEHALVSARGKSPNIRKVMGGMFLGRYSGVFGKAAAEVAIQRLNNPRGHNFGTHSRNTTPASALFLILCNNALV